MAVAVATASVGTHRRGYENGGGGGATRSGTVAVAAAAAAAFPPSPRTASGFHRRRALYQRGARNGPHKYRPEKLPPPTPTLEEVGEGDRGGAGVTRGASHGSGASLGESHGCWTYRTAEGRRSGARGIWSIVAPKSALLTLGAREGRGAAERERKGGFTGKVTRGSAAVAAVVASVVAVARCSGGSKGRKKDCRMGVFRHSGLVSGEEGCSACSRFRWVNRNAIVLTTAKIFVLDSSCQHARAFWSPPLVAASTAMVQTTPTHPPTHPRPALPNARPDGLDSEDGSWEGSVDWWPRPRSPLPGGVADAYYHSVENESGSVFAAGGGGGGGGGQAAHHYANPPPSQQGASSLLPAVPTFEESGTRVSWADYRGHRLAEVRGEGGGGARS